VVQRATSIARGYDKAHKALRASIQPTVDAGLAHCCEVICMHETRTIHPGEPWDLAHDRTKPGTYLGPAHQRCNRAEGAAFGNRQRGRRPTRRVWTL
jgi:hypothetical protein